jgi:hypothetical protein
MSRSSRRTVAAVLGSLLAAGLVILGIWVVADGDGTSPVPPAAPGSSSSAPSPSLEPSTPVGPSAQPSTPVDPSSTPATMTVSVYFHSGEELVRIARRVPRTPMVATAALRQLLAGPTAAERADGIWSWFSARTAGMLRSVRVADGTAYADFADLRPVIPNASTSAGSAALLGELDATLKQFSTVRRTVYSLNGDVATFYGWLQLAPPPSGRPEILQVATIPTLRDVSGWWQLPDGAGMVGFTATVRGADRVEFYLVPTGTNTWPQRRLLPNDAYAGHPYTARLDYRDEPLSAHLVVIATGPGGQTRYDTHNVYHP